MKKKYFYHYILKEYIFSGNFDFMNSYYWINSPRNLFSVFSLVQRRDETEAIRKSVAPQLLNI